MRAFSPATPPARRPTSVVAFNPASISGLRSRLLDANTFTSPIDSKYYLKDSSTTNTHLPRQGRAWLFDGSNDYGVIPAGVNSTWGSSFSVSFWTYFTGTNSYVVSVNNGSSVLANVTSDNMTFGNTTGFNTHTTVPTNSWLHWVCVYDSSLSGMSRWIIYKNGVLATVSTTGSLLAPSSSSGLVGIRSVGLNQPYNGSLYDIRIYSVAKTAGEVSAIYNQSRTGSGTFDTTGLVAAYPCNEESGTTGYDISGNGNHLTLTNITQATFHAANTGVLANPNNAEGYRLSGSVYIPKRLTDSLAADGNALTVTGRAAYHGCAETPCFTGNASNCYIDLGAALFPSTADFETEFWFYRLDSGTWTFLLTQDNSVGAIVDTSNRVAFYDGSNFYYTASNTVIPNTWHHFRVVRVGNVFTTHLTPSGGSTVTATSTNAATFSTSTNTLLGNMFGAGISGRLSNFRITTGGVTTYFPLQDGPGSSNTNRDIAWVKSDGTGGVISNAIVNGTVSTIWGNRVPGNVEDWCVKYGGRIAANGAFIAGMLTGGNAADGSAKTLAAGKFGNPFSRLNLNPATAAELNGKNIQTAYEDLPCVTGNGTNLYVDLGSSSFSVVGSTIRCAFFAPSGGSGGNTNKRIASRRNPSLQGWELYFSGGNNLVLFIGDGSGFTEHTLATSIPRDTWMLLDLTVSGSTIGSAITGSVNGVAISTTLPRAILESASNTNLLGSNAMTSYADTRLSGLSVTASGTTTYFPLSDGSGADLAWYKSDGTKGVVSSALQGTLTNVWANKTDGSKVAATKYALRAIVTRETEFNRVASDGDDRFLIYDNALSGADLSNVEGYVA